MIHCILSSKKCLQEEQNLTKRIKLFLDKNKKETKLKIGAVTPMQRDIPAVIKKQQTVYRLVTPLLQTNENISVDILEKAVINMTKSIEAAYLFTAEGEVPSCDLCDEPVCSICTLINSIIRSELF